MFLLVCCFLISYLHQLCYLAWQLFMITGLGSSLFSDHPSLMVATSKKSTRWPSLPNGKFAGRALMDSADNKGRRWQGKPCFHQVLELERLLLTRYYIYALSFPHFLNNVAIFFLEGFCGDKFCSATWRGIPLSVVPKRYVVIWLIPPHNPTLVAVKFLWASLKYFKQFHQGSCTSYFARNQLWGDCFKFLFTYCLRNTWICWVYQRIGWDHIS